MKLLPNGTRVRLLSPPDGIFNRLTTDDNGESTPWRGLHGTVIGVTEPSWYDVSIDIVGSHAPWFVKLEDVEAI